MTSFKRIVYVLSAVVGVPLGLAAMVLAIAQFWDGNCNCDHPMVQIPATFIWFALYAVLIREWQLTHPLSPRQACVLLVLGALSVAAVVYEGVAIDCLWKHAPWRTWTAECVEEYRMYRVCGADCDGCTACVGVATPGGPVTPLRVATVASLLALFAWSTLMALGMTAVRYRRQVDKYTAVAGREDDTMDLPDTSDDDNEIPLQETETMTTEKPTATAPSPPPVVH